MNMERLRKTGAVPVLFLVLALSAVLASGCSKNESSPQPAATTAEAGKQEGQSLADQKQEVEKQAGQKAQKTAVAVAEERQKKPAVVRDEGSKAPAPVPVARVCSNCGVITSIEAIREKGEGSGLGAVAGGVAGAVIGYQFGGGKGKAVTTAAGAAGGALAGHEIEKQVRKTTHYSVRVQMDDGSSRTLTLASEPSYRVGDKVKVANGALLPAD